MNFWVTEKLGTGTTGEFFKNLQEIKKQKQEKKRKTPKKWIQHHTVPGWSVDMVESEMQAISSGPCDVTQ